MKIGIVMKNYSPDMGGGYEYQNVITRSILEASLSSRHEFILLVEGNTPKDILIKNSKKLEIIEIYHQTKILFKIERTLDYILDKITDLGFPQIFFKKLERAADKAQIGLLFFPQPGHAPVSIPYITTDWDLQHRLQPWFPEVNARGEWERRERVTFRRLCRAYRIMTGTEEGKGHISSLYSIPEERIIINPFPVIEQKPVIQVDENSDSVLNLYQISSPFYLYPAQFWPHKNHTLLLDALTLLIKKYKYSPTFVFVGSDKGNLNFIRNQIKKMGLDKNVVITGFISREHLNTLYKHAEALIYPSWFGPDNLPPVEAIMAGCPVIASKTSGAYNQLGDGCLLFDPVDPIDVAEKIYSLVQNETLKVSILDKGKEKAYSWTINDFTTLLFSTIDEFELIRRCWESSMNNNSKE